MANWEGGGLGEIIEKGWHTLKPMPGMMHNNDDHSDFFLDNPVVL